MSGMRCSSQIHKLEKQNAKLAKDVQYKELELVRAGSEAKHLQEVSSHLEKQLGEGADTLTTLTAKLDKTFEQVQHANIFVVIHRLLESDCLILDYQLALSSRTQDLHVARRVARPPNLIDCVKGCSRFDSYGVSNYIPHPFR